MCYQLIIKGFNTPDGGHKVACDTVIFFLRLKKWFLHFRWILFHDTVWTWNISSFFSLYFNLLEHISAFQAVKHPKRVETGQFRDDNGVKKMLCEFI